MLSLLLKTGKVGEQIQVTTDTMIKGDSTEFGACSLPLSIVLMYLNPNPNPNPNVILTFGLGQSNVNLLCVYIGM